MTTLDWIGAISGCLLIVGSTLEMILLAWIQVWLTYFEPAGQTLQNLEDGHALLIEDFIKNLCVLAFGLFVFYMSRL